MAPHKHLEWNPPQSHYEDHQITFPEPGRNVLEYHMAARIVTCQKAKQKWYIFRVLLCRQKTEHRIGRDVYGDHFLLIIYVIDKHKRNIPQQTLLQPWTAIWWLLPSGTHWQTTPVDNVEISKQGICLNVWLRLNSFLTAIRVEVALLWIYFKSHAHLYFIIYIPDPWNTYQKWKSQDKSSPKIIIRLFTKTIRALNYSTPPTDVAWALNGKRCPEFDPHRNIESEFARTALENVDYKPNR